MESPLLSYTAESRFINADLDYINGYWTKMSPRKSNVAFDEPEYHVIDSTNPCCAFDDGVQNRLNICR